MQNIWCSENIPAFKWKNIQLSHVIFFYVYSVLCMENNKLKDSSSIGEKILSWDATKVKRVWIYAFKLNKTMPTNQLICW